MICVHCGEPIVNHLCPPKTIKRPEVTNRIIDLLDSQNTKGLKKYGTTIDQISGEKYDWRLMAMEELIDLAQYQQKEIMRLEKLLTEKSNGA